MRLLQRWNPLARPHHPYSRYVRYLTDARPFHPNDRLILLRSTQDRTASPLLTKPLTPGHRLDTHRGALHHDDLIGKRVRDVVRTTPGKFGSAEYRLHEVKLEEYVRFTRRLVTPLYPQDAQVIVGLMDLCPEPARWGEGEGEDGEGRLEILEAGTGHGALTLYLSRAVHAANPPLPRQLDGLAEGEEADHAAIEAWESTRRALIHSIEVSPKYSAHAQKIVKGFRHGQYYHNIDFHVGDVSTLTTSLLTSRNNRPFLSHAFLDLPGTENHLATVASALRTDGSLIVFCPSITQIMACLSTVKEDSIPLELEKVVELGVNGGTGGREWDVRAVKPRAAVKAAAGLVRDGGVNEGKEGEVKGRDDSGMEVGEGTEKATSATEKQLSGRADDGGWKMVCRPKVGELIVGGGFLGVFGKQRDMRSGVDPKEGTS